MASTRSVFPFIIKTFCLLGIALLALSSSATTIYYQTANNGKIIPQGVFKNASGAPIAVTTGTYGKLTTTVTLVEIDNYSFHNCKQVTSLTLPNSVTKLGYAVFSNFRHLESPIQNSSLFARCPISYTGEYTISSSTITGIASTAFKDCTGLTYIKLPATTTKIGESAFANCSNLEAITIPQNVTSIGHCAFWHCKNLKAIFIQRESAPVTINYTTFEDVDKESCILYVPEGYADAYKNADGWNEFKNIVEIDNDAYSFGSEILKVTDTNRDLVFESQHQAELKSISFNIELPEGLYCDEIKHKIDTIVCTSPDKKLTFNDNCLPGIYTVKISNIVLTDIGGNQHKIADYQSNIFVGDEVKAPTENGVVSFSGDYSTPEAFALLNEAIPVANVIDLTNVSSVPEGSFINVANANALIKTAVDLELANERNVVINSTCENLVVDDSDAFGTDEEFTAARVSYERAMKSTWGTVCMPFEVTSNNDVQFYTNGSVVNGVLSLEKADVVSAGQPAIFKRITNENLSISRNGSLTIAINPSENETSTQEIKLFGTYTKQVFTEGELYYIAQDKFWLKSEGNTLTVNPYRAWFTIDSSNNANNRSLTIEEESNEAASIKALNAMFDGSATYFDEQGRQISDLQSGMNIVKTPDGTIKKVLLK